MLLHEDKKKFHSILEDVQAATKINISLIEKDYFVTIFLEQLVKYEPLLVFKGGTCLSKCFKLIDRFSEDIDINLDGVSSLTQKRKKLLKKHIVDVIDNLKLELTNPEDIKSGMDYNLYKVSYPTLFVNPTLKQHLEVESVFRIEVFPTNMMPVTSIIYDFLMQVGSKHIIDEYGLAPFKIRVQALERTFVDKIFAIGDYYLSGRINAQSRHVYDLYKILPLMALNDDLKKFVEAVRQARVGKHDCLSAQDDVVLAAIIQKIIDEKTYQHDYNTITKGLLYEDVSYD